jgi:hypothetical protein
VKYVYLARVVHRIHGTTVLKLYYVSGPAMFISIYSIAMADTHAKCKFPAFTTWVFEPKE